MVLSNFSVATKKEFWIIANKFCVLRHWIGGVSRNHPSERDTSAATLNAYLNRDYP